MHRFAPRRSRPRAHWFESTPVVDLAATRLIVVALVLAHLLRLEPFKVEGADLSTLIGVHRATLAVGVLALLGLATNTSLLLFTAGNLYLYSTLDGLDSPHSFGAPEPIFGLYLIGLAALALSPTGRVLSLDAGLRRGWLRLSGRRSHDDDGLLQRSRFARWPLRLLQWGVALAYLATAAAAGSPGFVTLFEATFVLVLCLPGLRWVYLPLGVWLHATHSGPMGAWLDTAFPLYAAFVPWHRVLGSATALVERERDLGLASGRDLDALGGAEPSDDLALVDQCDPDAPGPGGDLVEPSERFHPQA
jgi:hypothetical protein